MKIDIQQWLLDSHDRPGWRTIGSATTPRGAERIAKRAEQGYGGLRHPDGGPRYGTVSAVRGNIRYGWDGEAFPPAFYLSF